MWDDECSLCLTPQAFNNINPNADIFNNINQQFWEYVLPGCDALGYIACTGTNFCLRARSLGMVSSVDRGLGLDALVLIRLATH